MHSDRPILLVLALLSGLLVGCARPSARLARPPERPGSLAVVPAFHEGTQARHERFNAISREGSARLVFVGDSITEGWETAGKDVWDRFYTRRKAANFGVSGDRTEHVLWRLEHGNFDGLDPRLIVLLIGTNNAGHRQDKPDETAAGIRAIVERLETKCPNAQILLLAILPRGQTIDDPCRRLNDQTNPMIKGLADGRRVVLMDLGQRFVDAQGLPRPDLMPDYLHLSPAGYDIWAREIEPVVSRALGE